MTRKLLVIRLLMQIGYDELPKFKCDVLLNCEILCQSQQLLVVVELMVGQEGRQVAFSHVKT